MKKTLAYQRLNLPSFIVSLNPLLWAGSCSLFHSLIFGIPNIFRMYSVLSNLAWPTDIMAVQLQYNVTAYWGNKYLVDKMVSQWAQKLSLSFLDLLKVIEYGCQKESNLTFSQIMQGQPSLIIAKNHLNVSDFLLK